MGTRFEKVSTLKKILIHSPPKVLLLTVDLDENFIDEASVTITSVLFITCIQYQYSGTYLQLELRQESMVFDPTFFTSITLSFGVIATAEMGDKSQLVCMALAARYALGPVFAGSILALLILNLLAVFVGSTLAFLIPESIIIAFAALLFAVFGIQSLINQNNVKPSKRVQSKPASVSFSLHC